MGDEPQGTGKPEQPKGEQPKGEQPKGEQPKGEQPKGKAKPKGPWLPKDTPKEVKDFLACKEDSVILDPTKLGWIGELPVVGKPDIKIEKGAAADSAKITLSGLKGTVKATLEISVKEGKLEANTGDLPGWLGGDKVKDWVDKFNGQLEAKKRKLKGLTVKDGNLLIEKVPVPAGGGKAKEPGPPKKKGKRLAAAGVGALLLVGAGAVAYNALSDDGGGGDTQQVASSGGGDDNDSSGTGGGFEACAAPLTCPSGDFPPVFAGAGVAIDHSGSVPDADTGEEGASKASLVAVTDAEGEIHVSADCAGQTVNGAAEAQGGVAVIPFPLYQFGPCQFSQVTLADGTTIPGTAVVPGGSFEVTEEEITEDDIRAAFRDAGLTEVVDEGVSSYLENVTTVLVAGLGMTEPPVECTAVAPLFRPDLVVEAQFPGCDPTGHAMYVLTGDHDITGGYVGNAPSVVVPDCGDGDVAFTACSSDDAPEITGSVVLSAAGYGEQVPVDGDTPISLGFTFDDGPTYEAAFAPGSGWTVSSDAGDTAARILIRNDSATLVVPAAEVGDVPGAHFTRDGLTVPAADEPALPFGSTFVPAGGGSQPTQAPTPEDEDPQDFADQLVASITGDGQFALERLAPAVLDQFSEQQCTASIADNSTTEIVIQGAGDVGPFDYAPPSTGQTSTVAEVTTFPALVTQQGQPQETDLHLQLVEGDWRWFTDCGG